jgi:hypothetical protein
MPMQTIDVTANALVRPEIDVSVGRIDFGLVHQGRMGSVAVTVTNRGGSELRVPMIALSATTAASYSVDPVSLPPLAPGAQQSFNVRYAPVSSTYPRFEGGTVIVASNDPSAPERRIALSGRGINPEARLFPAPPFNFNNEIGNPNRPRVYVGQQVELTTTVSNPGIGPLIITDLAIVGDMRGVFSFVSPPSLPATVQSNTNLVLRLRYAPSGVGNDVAELHMTTNDVDLGMSNGILVGGISGSAEGCPTVANATGTSNAGGSCTYVCNRDWHDLDNDLPTNGCEYSCRFTSATDLPDIDSSGQFTDANCDGIDGDPNTAIFVAPPPFGSDANPGTRAQPKATIQNAIQATDLQRNAVYVSMGTYVGPLTLVAGVSLYGGYDATANWRRADQRPTILGSNGQGVIAHNIRSTTIFDRFQVVSGNATAPGANSIGVSILNSTNGLQIHNSTIIAGDGAPGRPGNGGATGAGGNPGTVGDPGCSGCSSDGLGGAGGS